MQRLAASCRLGILVYHPQLVLSHLVPDWPHASVSGNLNLRLPAILLVLLSRQTLLDLFLPRSSYITVHTRRTGTIHLIQHLLGRALHRSIQFNHPSPSDPFRPTICLERATVKVLPPPLSSDNTATLRDEERRPISSWTAYVRVEDKIRLAHKEYHKPEPDARDNQTCTTILSLQRDTLDMIIRLQHQPRPRAHLHLTRHTPTIYHLSTNHLRHHQRHRNDTQGKPATTLPWDLEDGTLHLDIHHLDIHHLLTITPGQITRRHRRTRTM